MVGGRRRGPHGWRACMAPRHRHHVVDARRALQRPSRRSTRSSPIAATTVRSVPRSTFALRPSASTCWIEVLEVLLGRRGFHDNDHRGSPELGGWVIGETAHGPSWGWGKPSRRGARNETSPEGRWGLRGSVSYLLSHSSGVTHGLRPPWPPNGNPKVKRKPIVAGRRTAWREYQLDLRRKTQAQSRSSRASVRGRSSPSRGGQTGHSESRLPMTRNPNPSEPS